MDDQSSKHNSSFSHTYYIPVSISNWEGSLPNNEQERTTLPCILVITNGSGILTLQEQQFKLSRGCVVLWHNYQELKLFTQSHTTFQGTLITYRCVTNDCIESNVLKFPEPLQSYSSTTISVTTELERAWKQLDERKPFQVQQLFVELLVELYEELERQRQKNSSWMEQVLQYINTHFHEDLTRDQMAAFANVSPEHFSREFRKHTTQTFSSYIALLRIRASQNKLLYGIPKLESLAQEVGYKEGNYLSRKFKQLVGLSPTAFHHKQKRIVVLNSNHTACLLALGLVPELGVYTTWMDNVQQVKSDKKIDIYSISAHSLSERVASVSPDVIIDYNKVSNYQKLLELAPILALPFMNMSWKEQFRLIATVVNRQSKVEAWLKQYDEIIWNFNRELDKQLGDRGTAIVWEINANSAYCFHSSFGRGAQILYEDIGFQYPHKLLKRKIAQKGYLEIEVESIVDYPADHIFITGLPSNKEGKERMDRLFLSENWLEMEAVAKKQVYIMDQPDLFFGYDPLSSLAQIDELMKVLISQNGRAKHHDRA
ncbi:ABC transporter substrate-binding protein [Psychrobacillus sp. NPDC096389]|uniref:ABC transporter substrate-binding protein n=1 Tax=Psychrobacillus sp. NPDC096389 TaxID=3364490 RepID=UPI0038214540